MFLSSFSERGSLEFMLFPRSGLQAKQILETLVH
jgi:hypothetical protein